MKIQVADININTSKHKNALRSSTFWTFAATEWHRLYRPFVPYQTGLLYSSVHITGNGSTQTGTIEHYQPYAHYAYEGIVYGPNMPVMQAGEVAGYYSRPKPERKQPTGAMMHYNGTGTRHWDQAAKPTKLPLLIRTLQSYVDKMDK